MMPCFLHVWFQKCSLGMLFSVIHGRVHASCFLHVWWQKWYVSRDLAVVVIVTITKNRLILAKTYNVVVVYSHP